MHSPLTRRPEPGGASPQAVSADAAAAEYLLPASWRGIGAQAAAALGLLTGLWVALSRGSSRCSTTGTTPPSPT